MLQLDYTGKTPLYEQLYLSIKKEIEKGKIKSGEKLPSKRNLSKMLKISQITVENAYEQLKAEGYVYSVQKSGYFVQSIYSGFSSNSRDTIKRDAESNISNESYLYDLRGEKTDIESFPFSIWSKLTRQTLSEHQQNLLERTPNQGIFELRCEIASYLSKYRGIDAKSQNIIIGAGTEYILGLLSQLLPKSVFAFENPGYQKAAKVLNACGAKIINIPIDGDGISIEALKESNAGVVYVTPAHHFPLGTVMPINRRNELLSVIKRRKNSFIIEDDYNSEFRFSGRPIPTLYSIDNSQRVIYLGTFTQSLCPSLRISYMLLPDKLMEKYNSELSFYSSTVPSFEQYTLLKFMSDGYFERHLNRMRTIYKNRRDMFITKLRQSSLGNDILIEGNNAGLTILIKHKYLSEAELIQKAAENSVGILGLSRYYTDGKASPDGTVIIGYSALKPNEMDEIIQRLQKAWKA